MDAVIQPLYLEWAETHDVLRQGHLWRKDPTEGVCTKCGMDVMWVITQKGKNMPIDPDPTPYGRFGFTGEEVARKPIVYYDRNDGPVTGELLYKSHFATCDAMRKPHGPDPVV